MDEKKSALLIANSRYEDPVLRQLIAPAQDVEALAKVLRDPNIGGFELRTLLNQPSHAVGEEIEAFFSDRKRGELLLLYFSGHGVKDEDGRLYFATVNTKCKLLLATSVSANFVNDIMRRSRSRRQVLLLDCCYSGAFARGMLAKGGNAVGTKEHFEGSGRVILTASDATQYSFEGENVEGEGMRSVFTRTLVQGLETGEADLDGDGMISLDELYDYVDSRVTDVTSQQRPGKWVLDVKGEIVIGRNPRPSPKPIELKVAALKLPPAGYLPGQSEVVRPEERAKGIDLSHHNRNVSWDDIKSAGYSFAVIRATQGTSFVDSNFRDYWDGAKHYGLIRGAYHVFVPNQAAEEQAEAFLRVARPEPGDLPATVDVSSMAKRQLNKMSKPSVPTGSASTSNRDFIFKLAQFLTLVKTVTGRNPVIYTGRGFSRENFEALSELKAYPLWIANYSSAPNPNLPPNWPSWTFWQFTDKATIHKKILDANYFNGTIDDLKKFVGAQ